MHRQLRVALAASFAVALSAGTLAACGGSSGNGSSGGSTPAPSTAALPQLNGTHITVIGKWSGDEQKSFNKVLDDFESKTGATVKFTSAGDNTPTVIGTRVAAGNPPDVAFLPQPGLLDQLAKSGDIIPLPAATAAVVRNSYSKDWQDLGSSGGKLYGVWFKAANKSTVWYSTKAFQNAGITSTPTTWPDFVNDLKTLRDSGVQGPLSIGGADGWPLTDWFENVYIRTAGVDKYDQLAAHQIKWTDPSVKTALKMLGDLWGQSQLIQPNTLQTNFSDSVTQVFGKNKGAVTYEGDFAVLTITQTTKAKPGKDAKFFSFPSINGSPPSVLGGGDVAVMMKDNPGARALMAYLASPESAEVWAGLGGFSTANSNVPLSAYADPVSKASAAQLVNARIFRFDMSDLAPADFGGTPGQGEWKDLQDFFANPTDVNGTAAQLEKDAAKAYQS